ncbi:hypothetical protein ASF78_21320 [Cellulomonas sp. Leaf334]|nr:hypothetical protein ASF78_21320 [Cellulomonas sp. Leaf334]
MIHVLGQSSKTCQQMALRSRQEAVVLVGQRASASDGDQAGVALGREDGHTRSYHQESIAPGYG